MPRPVISIEFDEDVLETLLEQTPIVTLEDIGKKLRYTHSTIHEHLPTVGKINKLDKWILRKHSGANCAQRMNANSSLLPLLINETFGGVE